MTPIFDVVVDISGVTGVVVTVAEPKAVVSSDEDVLEATGELITVTVVVVAGRGGVVFSLTTFSTVVSLGLNVDVELVVNMISSFLVVVGKNDLVVVTSSTGEEVADI